MVTIVYPIAIEKEADSDYGVRVPDLPGCISAGRTLAEAIAMAREAITLHLEGLVEDGHPVPEPTPIERHQDDPEFAGGGKVTWAAIAVDTDDLRGKAVRVNISIQQRLLDRIDAVAAAEHVSRSALLQRAAAEYLAPATSPPGSGRTTRRRPRRRRKTA